VNEPIDDTVDPDEVAWCLCYELGCRILGHPANDAADGAQVGFTK